MQRRLRVSEGEQLDVVGLVKRAALGNRPYPSVARISADPWLRGLKSQKLAEFDRLSALCRKIPSAQRLYPVYKDFPFEGTVVYSSRHNDLKMEAGLGSQELEALQKIGQILQEIGSEPDPYLAVLVADGDKIGKAITSRSSSAKHREFSQKLTQFAGRARHIVESENRGVLVYAGGDDLLAFVPVDLSLSCARALTEKFHALTEQTLSIGVAIAHFMEPLEDLLGYGRAAESDAKQPDGNGLAVHVHKRGGGPVAVRANWSNADTLDHLLLELAQYLNGRNLPSRVATNLHEIARVYDGWPGDSLQAAIQGDTLSIMKGKERRGASAMPRIQQVIGATVKDAASLRRLADSLLVARQIAVAVSQASGQPRAEENSP